MGMSPHTSYDLRNNHKGSLRNGTRHGATLLSARRLDMWPHAIVHNAGSINERPRIDVPKLHVIEGGWDSRRWENQT